MSLCQRFLRRTAELRVKTRWLGDRDDYDALGRIRNWRAVAHDPMTVLTEKNTSAYVVVPVTGGRFILRGNTHGGVTDAAFRVSRCAFERNRFRNEFVQVAVAA
jgi:hypothetical protein